jgi:hypothetical protein
MALTGKFELRKSFSGKIVLRVEEEVRPLWRPSKPGSVKRRWRDATLMDLTAPELRFLIDLGLKPWARLQSPPASSKVADPQRTAMPVPVEAASAPVQQTKGEENRAVH